jgi:hypothetical protein
MGLSADRIFFAVILWLAVCSAPGRLAAGGQTMTSGELEQARSELTRIQAQQKTLEIRATEIRTEEERLDALVQALKQKPTSLPDALGKLRLDRALRQLRDRLLELQQLHREQQRLNSSEDQTRERIGKMLRLQADERLTDAERLFKAGGEGEADILYRQSLGLMEESERIAHAPIPPMIAESHQFDPELTGSENPPELLQMSVLMRHEAEEIEQESKYLDQIAQRIQADLVFEKRAARFQGVRGRESGSERELQQAADREIVLEGQLTDLLNRINQNRTRRRHFLTRAEEMEKMAAGKSPAFGRKDP